MHLWFERFDSHGRRSAAVIDTDNADKEVGAVWSVGVGGDRGGGINVTLFDGKYTAYNIHGGMNEAWGFVKGVEAALNRVNELLFHEAKHKKSDAA